MKEATAVDEEELYRYLVDTVNQIVREFLRGSSEILVIERPGRIESRSATWLRFYPTEEALFDDQPTDGRILRKYEARNWKGPSADVECVDTGTLFHVYLAECKKIEIDEIVERDARRALNRRLRLRGKRG